MNDHIGAGQVQSRAASLQGNQEDLPRTAVELLGHFKPLLGRGFPIQIHAAVACILQLFLENFQHGGELGEQQNPPPGLQGTRQDFQQHFHFAGSACIVRQYQGGMAADLPQLRNGCQHLGAASAKTLLCHDVIHTIP